MSDTHLQSPELSHLKRSGDRPCFLDHVESYLRQELAALDQHNPKAQDLRLQVYQEVFGFVIDEFKTYKPILSSIKYEYDTTLAWLREQIRDLVPLQETLGIVSEQYEKQLLDLRIQGSEEIHALKDECHRLRHIIKRMRDQQNALQTQVEFLKDDVAKQYQLYREERDARRLLITKICSIYLTKDVNSENPPSEKLELTACGDYPGRAESPSHQESLVKAIKNLQQQSRSDISVPQHECDEQR